MRVCRAYRIALPVRLFVVRSGALDDLRRQHPLQDRGAHRGMQVDELRFVGVQLARLPQQREVQPDLPDVMEQRADADVLGAFAQDAHLGGDLGRVVRRPPRVPVLDLVPDDHRLRERFDSIPQADRWIVAARIDPGRVVGVHGSVIDFSGLDLNALPRRS